MGFVFHSMDIQTKSRSDGTNKIQGLETGCRFAVMIQLLNRDGIMKVREYQT